MDLGHPASCDSPFFGGSEEATLAVAEGNSLAKRIGTKQKDEGSGSSGGLGVLVNGSFPPK